MKMTAELRRKGEEQMGRIGFALNQLLSRSKIPAFWGRKKVVTLKPEELLSVQFADKLRVLSLDYQRTGKGLRAVWCHVANERGKQSVLTHIILRAMGMLKGAPDYWFVWADGGCVIELKADGDLDEFQVYFERWGSCLGVKKAVHRTVAGAIAFLEECDAIV